MTILLTGVWQSGVTSTAAVAASFNTVMPTVGGWIVAFCVFLFGYTTLIGWAYYGEQFFEYILGRKVTLPYRWIYCLLIPFGAVTKVDLVWAWGDLMNALQVFPNLIGVLGLSGIVAAIARDKLARRSNVHGLRGRTTRPWSARSVNPSRALRVLTTFRLLIARRRPCYDTPATHSKTRT